jgi:hypothetical protein
LNSFRALPGRTAILVVSCDHYADLWAPFFQCFFKYWPDCPYPIYLGSGTRRFEDSRVTTLTIGEDVSYSDNLTRMLDQIEEDYVIFWVEDRMISGRVNGKQVAALVAAAIENRAAYLKLLPEHPLAYGTRGADWGSVAKGTAYRVSMTVALWHKVTLRAILRSGESAWDIERRGTCRSNEFTEPFLALSPRLRCAPPIPHVHVIVKGRLIRTAQSFLKREQLTDLLAHRQIESWRSTLYIWLYHRFFRIINPLRALALSRRRS